MVNRSFLIFGLLLLLSCSTGRIPKGALPGSGAYVKGELIYSLDKRPTPQAHASSIVETPEGILCAYFGGTHEDHDDVGIRLTRLVNGKWTFPEEVANGIINDSLRYPCWNPVLFLPRGGPLMLFYKVGPSPREWWGMLITSTDNGKTWSQPEQLGKDEKVGYLLGPVKNKPVQLQNGTIICPSSIERFTNGDDIDWRLHFEISKDTGRSWQVSGPINNDGTFDAIQPSLLVFPDGRIESVCRTAQHVVAASWSSDNGISWSELKALPLPNPNSGIDAVSLSDGRQLMVYNHSTNDGPEPKGRNVLNLALSTDGLNWKPVLTLENQPIEDGYSYPAVIQSQDGMVHITYTYNRRSIKYVVIDPSQL